MLNHSNNYFDADAEYSLVVLGKIKELCKVKVVDEIESNSTKRILCNTYWIDKSGKLFYTAVFKGLRVVVNGMALKCVSSTTTPEDSPYNTILELIEDNSGCDKTFYNGKCIVGCGAFDVVNHAAIYDEWKKLIDLVYSDDKTYKNEYTLCADWHSFQHFARWYVENKPTEPSKFGSYMLVKDLDGFRDCEIGPKNTLFIEKSIMKFPGLYTHALNSEDVYTWNMKMMSKKSKPGAYGVYHYDYENGKIKTLGTFATEKDARDIYLAFLSNRRYEIASYLKSKRMSMLQPLINKYESL